MSDDEHEHWPASGQVWHQPAFPAPGYDSNNGNQNHVYLPDGLSSRQIAYAPQPIYYPSPVAGNTQLQYYTQPMPTYAAYPQGYYAAVTPPIQHIPAHGVYPLTSGYGPPVNAWMGRTQAQVEEDNMKIAKREGVSEPRKVQPIGVKETQLFWVVELNDETPTLRYVTRHFPCVVKNDHDRRSLTNCRSTFMDIKELKGDWKPDPR